MKDTLRACWQDREVNDLVRLLGALLLLACVWALAGCGVQQNSEASSAMPTQRIQDTEGNFTIYEIRLNNETSCVVLVGFRAASISCDWRYPR